MTSPSTTLFWSPSRGKAILLLLLLAFSLILLRSLTYHEPFERDLVIYSVIAHEMLQGRPLYADMWDIKPPGVYGIYAAAQVLAGYGRNSIFLLGVVAALVTLCGLYYLVYQATKDRTAALWAAFFWVLIGSDIDLQANQPNTEVFINAAFVWAMALFYSAYLRLKPSAGDETSEAASISPHRRWLVAGLIWAVATLFKQVAFVLPLALSGFLLLAPSDLNRRQRVAGIAALLGPTFGLWALTFAYFALTGRAQIFYFSMVEFGRLYAKYGAIDASEFSLATRLIPHYLFIFVPLWLLICLAVWIGRKRLAPFWGVFGVCVLSTPIAISLPGAMPHYYQLWLPVFCLGGGLALAQLRSQTKPALVSWLPAAASLGLLWSQWPNWQLSPEQVSFKKFSTAYFTMLPHKARQIDAALLPDETLYQYGYDPGFYFETKRRPPVGVMTPGAPKLPLPRWFQERIIADLERQKPEVAIIDRGFPPSLITQYLDEKYVPLSGDLSRDLTPRDDSSHGHLRYMARRDGKLIRRLATERESKAQEPLATR